MLVLGINCAWGSFNGFELQELGSNFSLDF